MLAWSQLAIAAPRFRLGTRQGGVLQGRLREAARQFSHVRHDESKSEKLRQLLEQQRQAVDEGKIRVCVP